MKVYYFATAVATVLLWANSSHAQNNNPTGPTGQFNGNSTTGGSYDPYTANATRTITDLTVGGAVGAYPLQWSRTMNSRQLTSDPNGFGVGGWRHSYSWTMDDGPESGPQITIPNPPSPTSYTVDFPDGRSITFNRAVTGDSGYFHGPLGVAERFQALNTTTKLAYLILPDGGKIEFTATKFSSYDGDVTPRQYYAHWMYQATGIIDPNGLKTTLAYSSTGAAGQLTTITEPAKRWLKLSYVSSGPNSSVISRVDAGYGSGTTTQSVTYGYAAQLFGGVSYSVLTGATYLNEAGTPAAAYTYQASNLSASGAPLVGTCNDPHFTGPMKKIAYAFDATTPGRNYGQLLSEKYFAGTAVVATLGINGNSRTETRGDGALRTWRFGTTPVGTGFNPPPSAYFLTEASDFNAKYTYIEYDGNGFADRTKNAVGAVSSFARLALTGKVSLITLPADSGGSTATKGYGYSDPTTGYYLTSTTDERSKITSYLRNADHRVYQINYPDASSEAFLFDANGYGRVTRKTLKNGAYVHYSVDTQGLVFKEWNPTASSSPIDTEPKTLTQYYPAGDPWENYVYKVTDQLSHVTTYEYEKTSAGVHCTGRGLVTKITHNDGKYLQYGYNTDGTLAWSADENHLNATATTQSTRYIYDDYKRVTSKTDPLGHSTTYNYVRWNHGSSPYDHTYGFVFRQTSPLQELFDHDCDDNYRAFIRRDAPFTADDAMTWYTYDDVGNLQTVKDPRGNTTTYFYDNRGRMIGMDDSLSADRNSANPSHTVSWTYDTPGNITKEQRANDQLITSQFDAMGRLQARTVQRTPTVSDTSQMSYWPDGNLMTMVDPLQKTYSYDYDLRGHKWHATYPLDSGTPAKARQEIWVYDAAGNLQTFQNRAGNVQTFVYDDRNRATAFSWDDGTTPSQINHYDAASRLTGVDNSSGSVGMSYFDDNTLQSQTQTPTGLPAGTQWTTNYTSDADGRRATIVYPSTNAYTYTYSRRNQLLNINDTGNPGGTPVVTYTYDPNGNRLTRDLRNGGQSDYTIDPAMNRVTNITHQFADQQWQSNYGYDKTGRLTYEQRKKLPISAPSPSPSPTPAPGTSDLADGYVYNVARELTTFTRDGALQADGTVINGSAVVGLTYDANGNRTATNGAAYAVNDLNEYTTANGTGGLTYDLNGNLKQYNGWAYTYDAQNRLTAAVGGTPLTTVIYTYDGLNRQLYHDVTVGSMTTRTYNVWDGWNLLEERDASGAVAHCYIHGAATDEIVSRFQGGLPTLYYYQDGRGNTTHLAGDLNFVQERYTYGYAGNVTIYTTTGVTPPKNRFLFTGRDYMSETGLYDYRSRFYLPGIGRFLQPDRIGFNGDANNIYRYCVNDPINFTDPTGEIMPEVLVVGGAVVLIGIIAFDLWYAPSHPTIANMPTGNATPYPTYMNAMPAPTPCYVVPLDDYNSNSSSPAVPEKEPEISHPDDGQEEDNNPEVLNPMEQNPEPLPPGWSARVDEYNVPGVGVVARATPADGSPDPGISGYDNPGGYSNMGFATGGGGFISAAMKARDLRRKH